MNLFFLLSILLILMTPIIFFSSKKLFLKIHKWVKDKIIKKKETLFRHIYLFLLWFYVIYFIFQVFNSNHIDKLILSISFVLVILVINSFSLVSYLFFLFPFEFFSIVVKKILPKKTPRDKEKKKQDFGTKISNKILAISRFRINTILIYSIILLSFSFEIIIDDHNYWWIGGFLACIITVYLLFELRNIFLTQKDLIFASDSLEEVGHFINSFKDNDIFIISKQVILGFLKNYAKPDNKYGNLLDKAISWVKKNFRKVQFISRMGVAVFRSILTIKLISIIVTTLLFYLIVVSNYLISLEKLNLLTTSFTSYTEYYLSSFYLFIGESTGLYTNTIDPSFFSGMTLYLGVSGWLLSVTYIVLYFDIMNLSSSDFNAAVNKAVMNIFQEVKVILEEMNLEEPDLDLNSIIQDLKSDSNILTTDPKKAEKLKSIIEKLGKSNKDK